MTAAVSANARLTDAGRNPAAAAPACNALRAGDGRGRWFR